jgi:hypothetical protein
MATVTIAFAAVGFLSPSNRGALLIAMLLFYVVAGNRRSFHFTYPAGGALSPRPLLRAARRR